MRDATRGAGNSFKKLAAYLTQPRDGQHRALWTSAENVGSDDPRTAARIMAHTAMNADALKEAAGVRKGGRKAETGPVRHFVLSWDEGQQPTQEHQLETARGMLAAIGLDKAQAVIVAHNDNGYEHLHIMANLVDPETGKRFSLSNHHHKIDAFATEYMERAGTLEAMPKRAAKVAAKAKGEPHPERATRISRPAMERITRATREAAYTRQAAQRAEMFKAHSAEWTAAKREAADQKRAYKAAFRAAYERAKAEDKTANRPHWRTLFRAQEADRASMARAVDFAQQRAERARIEAKAATRATVTAERRSRSMIGALAQRIGIAATPERAASRQVQAAEAMRQAALELATVELAKAGLKAKQDAERGALATALGDVTFAKAQLATDTLPRFNFDAMVQRQTAEKAAMIEQQNAERDALGMKHYEPKPSRKDEPMTTPRPLAEQDETRRAFAKATDRRAPKTPEPAKVQGAAMTLRPDGSRGYGTTPGAPVKQPQAAEQDNRTAFATAELAKAPDRFTPQRRAEDKAKPISPLAAARERNNTPEAKAERARQAEQARQRDQARDRDDFER